MLVRWGSIASVEGCSVLAMSLDKLYRVASFGGYF